MAQAPEASTADSPKETPAAEVASKEPAPAEASASSAAPAEAEASTAAPAEAEASTAAANADGEAPKAAEAAPPAPEPEVEVCYDDPDDTPEKSFQNSRDAVGKIHAVLDTLIACKKAPAGEAEFPQHAQKLQLDLLRLRRTHRSMVKASDMSRAAEINARRKVDAAVAHLEQRQYESGCLRQAAARCRNVATPELDKLRPNLRDGAHVAGDDPAEESTNGDNAGKLGARLQAEREEREKLDSKLQELETIRTEEVAAIEKLLKKKTEFADLVRSGLKSFEPALNLIETQPRSASSVDSETLCRLPAPLHVIYSKFENIANYSEDSGVAVRIEGLAAHTDGQPPEKKARVEANGAGSIAVCVTVSPLNGAKASTKPVGIRFTSPHGAIVKVCPEVPANAALLQGLWSEDNGLKTVQPDGVAELPGRAFYWAQVLAGLRGSVTTPIQSLAAMDTVSAMDVVTKVRAKMTSK